MNIKAIPLLFFLSKLGCILCFAQPAINNRDLEEIIDVSEEVIKEFESFLNKLTTQNYSPPQKKNLVSNQIKSSRRGRLFFSKDVLLENDINPEVVSADGDKYIGVIDYFESLLQLTTSTDSMESEVNILLFKPLDNSKDYPFLEVIVETRLGGTHVSGRKYPRNIRVIELVPVEIEGEWNVYINEIKFAKNEIYLESEDINLVYNSKNNFYEAKYSLFGINCKEDIVIQTDSELELYVDPGLKTEQRLQFKENASFWKKEIFLKYDPITALDEVEEEIDIIHQSNCYKAVKLEVKKPRIEIVNPELNIIGEEIQINEKNLPFRLELIGKRFGGKLTIIGREEIVFSTSSDNVFNSQLELYPTESGLIKELIDIDWIGNNKESSIEFWYNNELLGTSRIEKNISKDQLLKTIFFQKKFSLKKAEPQELELPNYDFPITIHTSKNIKIIDSEDSSIRLDSITIYNELDRIEKDTSITLLYNPFFGESRIEKLTILNEYTRDTLSKTTLFINNEPPPRLITSINIGIIKIFNNNTNFLNNLGLSIFHNKVGIFISGLHLFDEEFSSSFYSKEAMEIYTSQVQELGGKVNLTFERSSIHGTSFRFGVYPYRFPLSKEKIRILNKEQAVSVYPMIGISHSNIKQIDYFIGEITGLPANNLDLSQYNVENQTIAGQDFLLGISFIVPYFNVEFGRDFLLRNNFINVGFNYPIY